MRKRLLLISLLTLLALFSGSASYAADEYTFNGYGYGHGIGLCQWGAKGRADAGQSYTEMLSHYYQGTQVTNNYAVPDTVRVRLFGKANLVKAYVEGEASSTLDFISANGTYIYKGASGKWQIAPTGTGTLKLIQPDGKVAVDNVAAPIIASNATANITVYNSSGGRKHAYKGTIYAYPVNSSALYLVNYVNFEPEYLNGLGEVPFSWPYDALYAQVVAARSYAIANMHPQNTFDLYDDTNSQVYYGVDKVSDPRWGPRWVKAVADTQGQVVTYNGKCISTYYFSSCGGHTESIELAWTNGKAQPYLKGVSDLNSQGKPYCQHDSNSSFAWTKTITKADLESKLGVAGITGLRVTKTGVSPRIVELQISKADGTSTPVSGQTFRTKLGLKSAWVSQMGGTFPDVPMGYWAFGQIEELAKRNVVGGYSDGTFRPGTTVKRSEFAKMLCIALSIPSGGASAFSDVGGHWSEPYVAALASRSVIGGYADGTFRPDANITRAEICAIIARAKSLTRGSTAASFPDIDGHWAKDNIEIVASNGVVTGYPQGVFKPDANATRAEVSVIISRVLSK